MPPEQIFLGKAGLLSLSAPEWTALVGGLRVLDTNSNGAKRGVFTDRPGVLSNDYFINLTTMDYVWKQADTDGMGFEPRDRDSDAVKFTATRCDLIFGANTQLRQISKAYAADDGHEKLVRIFKAGRSFIDADARACSCVTSRGETILIFNTDRTARHERIHSGHAR